MPSYDLVGLTTADIRSLRYRNEDGETSHLVVGNQGLLIAFKMCICSELNKTTPLVTMIGLL